MFVHFLCFYSYIHVFNVNVSLNGSCTNCNVNNSTIHTYMVTFQFEVATHRDLFSYRRPAHSARGIYLEINPAPTPQDRSMKFKNSE